MALSKRGLNVTLRIGDTQHNNILPLRRILFIIMLTVFMRNVVMLSVVMLSDVVPNIQMEQHTLKYVNNCLNANIYSYLETSSSQIYNLYLNLVHFFGVVTFARSDICANDICAKWGGKEG